MTEAIAYTTFDEFLGAEQGSGVRHELVGGRAWLMAGGTERHDLAAQLLYETLVGAARLRRCRTFPGNRLLRTPADVSYYPDLMIVCGPAAHILYETSPAVIVEVASPSTIGIDRREKAIAYADIDTVTQYAIVEPNVRRIEVADRSANGWSWRSLGPGDVWEAHHCPLVVDEFYDRLDADAALGSQDPNE